MHAEHWQSRSKLETTNKNNLKITLTCISLNVFKKKKINKPSYDINRLVTLSSVTIPFLSLSKSKKNSLIRICFLKTSALMSFSISLFTVMVFFEMLNRPPSTMLETTRTTTSANSFHKSLLVTFWKFKWMSQSSLRKFYALDAKTEVISTYLFFFFLQQFPFFSN